MGIYVLVILKRTVILQKKAIIYMHKAHYNAHTKPLFYASNVLNNNFTYLLEVSNFMHDYTRRRPTLPTPLLNFFSSNLTFHQHNPGQVLDPHFFPLYIILLQKNIEFIGDPVFGPTFLRL